MGLLAHVAADLLEEPEFNIGEMPLHVDDVTSLRQMSANQARRESSKAARAC